MNKILSLFLLTVSTLIYSQKKEIPNSVIDIGIGAGSNYGIFRVKTIIGYQGSGLLIGLGNLEGYTTYEVGIQVSQDWLFANIGHGVYGIATNGYTGKSELIKGTIAIIGGKINLLKNKALFIELGIGYASTGTVRTPAGSIPLNGPTGIIGINYRIGNLKKKKEEVAED